MFAQDKHKRDIAIKLVKTDSVEHQVHVRLMGCAEFNRPESFPFIIPTLDVLPSPHDFSFVSVSWIALPHGCFSVDLRFSAGVTIPTCLNFRMFGRF
jgi:hypothetical protein